MKHLQLTLPFPLGRLLDALEHLPQLVVTPKRPSLVRSVMIAAEPVDDEAALRARCQQGVENDADVMIVVDPERLAVRIGTALPLPVITVSPETPVEAIVSRLQELENGGEARRAFAEERAHSSIVDIVDRAAEVLGGHIIVEDQDFRILAYSQPSKYMDDARRTAILERQLPAYLQQIFNAQGVQASLLSGEDVVRAAPVPDAGLGPRLIVAVRHHGRLVGTIWFARETPSFSDEDILELQDAAKQMSAILADALRERHDEQIRRDDAAHDLLSGRRVLGALRTLGRATSLPRGAHVLTFAQVPSDGSDPAIHLAEFRALVESTARSVRSDVLTVPEDDRLHIIHFGCEGPRASCTADRTRRIATQLTENLQKVKINVAVGIGQHAERPSQIVRSAQGAERVLSGLLRMKQAAISTVHESWAALTIESFLNVASPVQNPVPPDLSRLFAPSTARDREQLLTVRTAIDHWGDVGRAAQQLHVHQNTVRYRLQRFSETTGVDLETPANRLALWMLLIHLDFVEGDTD